MVSRVFSNKRMRRFVSCKAGCPLVFNQRWVFSYVVFHASRPSTNAVAVALGMKHATVKGAVAALEGFGLAKTSDRKIRACQPAQDWFARWNKRDGTWRDCMGYCRIPVMAPTCPLTATQNTLYGVLVSLAGKKTVVPHQSCAGLATMLGVSRKTVKRALDELRFWQLLLLHQQDRFFDVRLLEPDSDVVSWYEDKPHPKQEPKREMASTSERWKVADVEIEEVDGPLVHPGSIGLP
jgi:DNA-binding transcriptional regulator YhcF (GntR family)